MATFLEIGLVQGNAQVSTNVDLEVHLALSGFRQDTDSNAVPIRIVTKDLITALNAVKVDGTNIFDFGPGATLRALSGSQAVPARFFVWEERGTNIFVSDVSPYISAAGSYDVHDGASIYSILTFQFDNGQGSFFTVQGLLTARRGKVSQHTVGTRHIAATIAGTGSFSDRTEIFHGTFVATNPRESAAFLPAQP